MQTLKITPSGSRPGRAGFLELTRRWEDRTVLPHVLGHGCDFIIVRAKDHVFLSCGTTYYSIDDHT